MEGSNELFTSLQAGKQSNRKLSSLTIEAIRKKA
jgi:hypothetical protein